LQKWTHVWFTWQHSGNFTVAIDTVVVATPFSGDGLSGNAEDCTNDLRLGNSREDVEFDLDQMALFNKAMTFAATKRYLGEIMLTFAEKVFFQCLSSDLC